MAVRALTSGTVENGFSESNGGAIAANGGTLIIDSCSFAANGGNMQYAQASQKAIWEDMPFTMAVEVQCWP